MTKALSSRVLDAQDLMSDAKNLNEAIYMAASDIQDRDKMSAIQAVADIIDKRLLAAREILEAVVEDME
ncbi:hypothetical protein [Rhizobium tubonense]|uniref:Uncharacterized protein n=1 Tax=Rhizobium tubonense TaxID=484088 RepID=A0A2W4CQ69_9HYPH|nr:hypothetical protein [Rhizobium tubonense]PZM07604.1 hypothetical protein CPY51_31235 [Rhizobium tubonense]